MKCGLVQILAVTMLLGYTVSIDGFVDQWIRPLLGLTTVGGYYIPSSLKRVELSTNSVVKLIDGLRAEFANVKKQLAAIKFEQFDSANTEEVRVIVNKLYDIRKHADESTHKYKDTLVKNVDDEINALIVNLEKAKQKAEDVIKQNREYYWRIHKELFEIDINYPVSDVKIKSIRNTCKKAGIACPNINKHLSQVEMKQKLKEVYYATKNKLKVKYTLVDNLVDKIGKLLGNINDNKHMQTLDDTRDTEPMRNAIDISKSTAKAGTDTLPDLSIVEKPTTSREVILIDKLYAEFANAKSQLVTVNFEQLDNTNIEKVRDIVNNLLDIRKRADESTHEEKDILFTNVDNEINALEKKLQKARKNIDDVLKQNNLYQKQIYQEVSKMYRERPVSEVDIRLVRDTCNKAGIECPNINEHLSQEEMEQKLEEVYKALANKVIDKRILVYKIYDLLINIKMNKYKQKWYDMRDTQSMRNVITISIAVCVIVTLCIVLLIAVCNKNRTNTGVRLFDRV